MKSYLGNIYSLLDDDAFIQWIINPTPELDAFWNDRMSKDNELERSIHILKNTIKKIRVEEPSLSTDEKKLIWENIKQSIEQHKPRKKVSFDIWTRIGVAAAFIGILFGSYLYIANDKKIIGVEYDYISMLDDKDPSQSENISLVLSDNRVVNIQKDSSSVEYDNAGRIKIGSEQIEYSEHEEPSLNQLIVPYGKTTFLTLSDGTKIWVNSGTKLIYPSKFEKNKREIFVMGEIYLDVTKDEKCPFVIKTDCMDVNVLGTKLNVSAYNDDSSQSVVLVSGAVNVKSKELNETYDIYPSQRLSYGISFNEVDIRNVDVNNYTSWVNGYLLLKSESLIHVFQRLERHFNVSFSYNSKELENIYVSGKLDLRGSIQNCLKYINITVPIHYKMTENTIKITLKPEN